ncbi:DUF3617 family protein [Rhizobium sp. LCM 4573]|uniref:DUF3617 domain-containing protein n=1 Tax=Rhizobium sp. LCM 4573 TaxID=1848291 RepID=UPI00091EF740|nr:DUF3617 family protein [Rhizobium sp. LCM 4573]OHV79444.1 hypothetical protein LCM4573_25375 [Rhizobium sp. LCM 4573]
MLVILLGLSTSASSFELPRDLPAREEGLWVIDQIGTISDGKTTFDIQKIWNICLDAKADHALHELELREQQASVASHNETCEEPQSKLSDNSLSWTMHCSGPSPIEDKIGKTYIQHSTTFLASDEARSESVIVNRDNLIQSRGSFVTRMKRLGACQDSLQPGDMMLMHWRVNGEETLKGRQSRNIYSEIANHIEFTKSRLAQQ